MSLPMKAHAGRRGRVCPCRGSASAIRQEQAEVDRRVAIYARQVEQTGRITWLPHRGEGQSA